MALLGVKPLWLDEIIQLQETSDIGFSAMVDAARNPGASLLPNILGWLVLHLGHSRELARVPAVLFGVASCLCFWLLAREVGLRYPVLASVVFALLPINFRYTTEARPYSQAVFFCSWALLLLFRIDVKPSLKQSFLLFAAVTGGLYSQPFVLLPLASVVCASVLSAAERRIAARFQLAPLIAAVVVYLPWYLVAVKTWNGGAASGSVQPGKTVFDNRIVLRIIREWTGGGYFVGGLLIVLIILALMKGGRRRMPSILLSGTLGGLVVILLAEDRLHYFFAARHLIFTLPTAVLLASTAFESEAHWGKSVSFVCSAALIVISTGFIIAEEIRPHEDWELVAKRLVQLGQLGNCIEGVSAGQLVYFDYFEPGLKSHACSSEHSRYLALVVDPYSSNERRTDKLRELSHSGWLQRETESIGKFQIMRFASR